MTRLSLSFGIASSLFLSACVNTDKLTFFNYGKKPNPGAAAPSDPMVAPAVSDGLAINYANSMEIIMRANATRSRITREVSSTAQVALAAFGGVGAAFNYSATTLAALGMSSAGIPELQKLFNAKGRAEAYNQAAEMIKDGVWEYYSLNPSPSSTDFTPNGLTLVKRVSSAISLVDTALVGQLPSRKQMLQAVEEMSPEGTVRQQRHAHPVNSMTSITRRTIDTTVQTIGTPTRIPPRKFAPVVIAPDVLPDKGAQTKEAQMSVAMASRILKKTNAEEAKKAGEKLLLPAPKTGQDPREVISEALGASDISSGRALEIANELDLQTRH